MKWTDRLVASAEKRAEAARRRKADAIVAQVRENAPWLVVERVIDGLRVRGRKLFRQLMERPDLRAAMRGER